MMVMALVSCEERTPNVQYNLTGKILYGFDDYTPPLSGSTTQYYIGYKFLSTTTAIEFKASFTPPVVLFSDTIVKEQFSLSKSGITYSINDNYILLNNYSGEIYSDDSFNITSTKTKIYLFELDENDKIGRLIKERL